MVEVGRDSRYTMLVSHNISLLSLLPSHPFPPPFIPLYFPKIPPFRPGSCVIASCVPFPLFPPSHSCSVPRRLPRLPSSLLSFSVFLITPSRPEIPCIPSSCFLPLTNQGGHLSHLIYQLKESQTVKQSERGEVSIFAKPLL